MTVAFVLQGGASLAAAQVGMLRALHEAGITPDLVVGTSAGAVNAVGYAQDPSSAGLDAVEQAWRAVRRRDVLPLGLGPVVGALRGRSDGVVSPEGLRSWIAAGIVLDRLQDAAVPVGVVATDAESGRAVVLRSGDAVDALLASTAVPGVYPSVTIAGRRLVDGGVSADVPVPQAAELGATTSYVLPRAQLTPTGRPGVSDRLLRTLQHLLDHQDAGQGGPRHVVRTLPAPLSDARSPFDFRDTGRLIDAAYNRATRWLRTGAGQVPVLPSAAAA